MRRDLASWTLLAACLTIAGCAADRPYARVRACVFSPGVTTRADDPTEAALREVLQDERRAGAFYAAVMEEHGAVRPFWNIARAERRHEAAVITLMNRHDVTVPEDSTPAPAVPATLADCYRDAAQIERDNVAMCDRLLATVTEPDVRATFEYLKTASQRNHLPAFERGASGQLSTPATNARPRRFARDDCPRENCCGACVGPCGVLR